MMMSFLVRAFMLITAAVASSGPGDIRIPLASGRLNESQIVGDSRAVVGNAPPSFSKHDVVVFKSIGIICAGYCAG